MVEFEWCCTNALYTTMQFVCNNVVMRTLASIVDFDSTQQTEILRLSGF